MAWTTPMTFVSGNVLTAAQLNTHLRDNLIETSVGKATAAAQVAISQGNNRIAMRTPTITRIDTSEATDSTSYADLASAGPSVTVTHGSKVLVGMVCRMVNSVANSTQFASYAMTGDNERDPQDVSALSSDGKTVSSSIRHCTYDLPAVTPGTTTFTMKYGTGSGTGTFSERVIVVWPF